MPFKEIKVDITATQPIGSGNPNSNKIIITHGKQADKSSTSKSNHKSKTKESESHRMPVKSVPKLTHNLRKQVKVSNSNSKSCNTIMKNLINARHHCFGRTKITIREIIEERSLNDIIEFIRSSQRFH